jgi:hypothetical protein
MSVYTVHRRGMSKDDVVFVKDGFSWPGFVFTVFWLVYKRMWIVAAIVAAVLIGAPLLGAWSGSADLVQSLLGLAIGLIIGFEGNDLERWSLARQGYREVDCVEGCDLEEAELKHFSSQAGAALPSAPVAVAPPATQPSLLATDALGLFSAPGKQS